MVWPKKKEKSVLSLCPIKMLQLIHLGATTEGQVIGEAARPTFLLHVSFQIWEVTCDVLEGETWEMIWSCAVSFQAQSQGSITLKIIPATQEEDRLKDSKVWRS